MDLVSYLQSKDITLKQGGNNNVYTHCWYCNESPEKRGRLYIQVNPESERWGAHYCFLCNESGGINRILAHFGDPPLQDVSEFPAILTLAADYYAEKLYENPDAYRFLTHKRGLTDETIRTRKLGWADGTLLTHLIASGCDPDEVQATGLVNKFGSDFLQNRITIPYFDFGSVVSIRGKEIGGGYLSLPGSTARLYGIDQVRGKETVVATAGEFDCMVMQQLGYDAVGVPGENIWKAEWTAELSEARRIFIIFDNDAAGRAGAEKLATTLGPRSRVVEMPPAGPGQKKIDITEWYVNHNKVREDFDFLLSKAKGGLLVSVAQAHDRWLEVEGNPDRVGLRFNIKGLDSEMGHGLLPGQVVVLIARSNSGKSVMSYNVLHRMRMMQPNLKILLISLEQTRNEWFERAYRIMNFYEPGSTTHDTINFWKDNLFIVDENRVSFDGLESCIDQYAFESGSMPDVVLIDYLGYYARSYKGEEYARISSAIMDLKALAKRNQLVCMVPHQANRSNDLGNEVRMDQGHGSGVVEQTADVALTMWNPDQNYQTGQGIAMRKEDQRKELLLRMPKARDSGVGTLVQFQFAPLTLAIVPKDDAEFYPRAVRERQYWIAGYDWKQAVNAYLTGDESVEYAKSETF